MYEFLLQLELVLTKQGFFDNRNLPLSEAIWFLNNLKNDNQKEENLLDGLIG